MFNAERTRRKPTSSSAAPATREKGEIETDLRARLGPLLEFGAVIRGLNGQHFVDSARRWFDEELRRQIEAAAADLLQPGIVLTEPDDDVVESVDGHEIAVPENYTHAPTPVPEGEGGLVSVEY